MRILVKSGHNIYEEFAIQAFSAYFMSTLQPAKETCPEDAEGGETKTLESGIKPNLFYALLVLFKILSYISPIYNNITNTQPSKRT